MRALVLETLNQALNYKQVSRPLLERNEQEVKVHYAAINHRDIWIAKGMYARIQLPVILGSDLCGTVDGAEVLINPGWNWGDNEAHQSSDFQILGMPHNGGFAEYVAIPKAYIYPKPSHLTMPEAAALPLACITAYRALFVRAQLKSSDRILITGIGGGVALMALQMALAVGAEVFVTSGDDEKIKKAMEMGASAGANYQRGQWWKSLKEISSDRDFDVILDSAGGAGFKYLVNAISAGGSIVLYGGTRGNYQEVNPQMIFWKQISILGTTMGSDQDFKNMLQFVEQYKIRPVIDEIFPLNQGQAAFDKMAKGQQMGKLVLKII